MAHNEDGLWAAALWLTNLMCFSGMSRSQSKFVPLTLLPPDLSGSAPHLGKGQPPSLPCLLPHPLVHSFPLSPHSTAGHLGPGDVVDVGGQCLPGARTPQPPARSRVPVPSWHYHGNPGAWVCGVHAGGPQSWLSRGRRWKGLGRGYESHHKPSHCPVCLGQQEAERGDPAGI